MKSNYQNTKVQKNHLSIQLLLNDNDQETNTVTRKTTNIHTVQLLSSFLEEESFRKQLIQFKKIQK